MTKDLNKRARQEYNKARIANLKSQVTIYDVLRAYNVPIRTEGAEEQYPCPLHGDGQDSGYSARVYPDEDGGPGGNTYCWGCQKARDLIEWVKDKESVSFGQALKLLEANFKVTNIPNVYQFFDPNHSSDDVGPAINTFQREMESILSSETVQENELIFLGRKIDRLVSENHRDLKKDSIVRLYYVYDSLVFDVKHGNIPPEKAKVVLSKLVEKVNELAAKG